MTNNKLEKIMMSEYLLYGERMVKNDATLKDFAESIYENIPMEVILEDSEERRDFILEAVEAALEDDIARTDIDYEALLYKYRYELGDLFYKMLDIDYRIPPMQFFGKQAKQFFNDIIYYYIAVHYEEFTYDKTIESETVVKRDYYVSYSGSNIISSTSSDEACELALGQINIYEVNAYPMNKNGVIFTIINLYPCRSRRKKENMNVDLIEIKKALKSENCIETETNFLYNDYGKFHYRKAALMAAFFLCFWL